MMPLHNYRIYFYLRGKRVMVDARATSLEAACDAVFRKYGYDLNVYKTIQLED